MPLFFQACLIQTHLKLASPKKDANSILAYFYCAKMLADIMAAIGRPLPDVEFLLYLLVGLGSDYNAFVFSVATLL